MALKKIKIGGLIIKGVYCECSITIKKNKQSVNLRYSIENFDTWGGASDVFTLDERFQNKMRSIMNNHRKRFYECGFSARWGSFTRIKDELLLNEIVNEVKNHFLRCIELMKKMNESDLVFNIHSLEYRNLKEYQDLLN